MEELLEFQMSEIDVEIVNKCSIYGSSYISIIKEFAEYKLPNRIKGLIKTIKNVINKLYVSDLKDKDYLIKNLNLKLKKFNDFLSN